jgi:hypothetical protein
VTHNRRGKLFPEKNDDIDPTPQQVYHGFHCQRAGSVKLVRRAIYDIPIISSGVFGEAERIIRARRRGFRIGVKEVEHFPRRSGKALGASVIGACREQNRRQRVE